MSKQLTVAFSSINFGKSQHGLRSPQWLGDFSRGAQCDGVELMPMFDLVPGHTPRAIGRAVTSGELDLNSLHATFRTNAASADTNKSGENSKPGLVEKVVNSSAGRLLLPEVVESAAVMRKIQHEAGVQVPAVLYPQRSADRDAHQITQTGASEALFQVTDHTARLVGAGTLDAMNERFLSERGYGGYVVDTFHVRRQYGTGEPGLVSSVSSSLEAIAPHTRAIHLSLNRRDITGESHIPTENDAHRALAGDYTGSQMGDMLDVLKEQGNVQYAVIEATAGDIAAVTGHGDVAGLQEAYGDIAQGLREYWAA